MARITPPGVTNRDVAVPLIRREVQLLVAAYPDIKFTHWNMIGSQFIQLHELVDEFTKPITKYADAAAERLAAYGEDVYPGDFEPPVQELLDAPQAARRLAERLDYVASVLARDSVTLAEADPGWSSTAADFAYEIGQWVWKLRAHDEVNAALAMPEITAKAVPMDWFTLPAGFEGGHTVTEDGRVYGYLAKFGESHSNMGDTYIQDHDLFDYTRFHNSGLHALDDGRTIAVGRIALDGGHNWNAYDDIRNQAAHVRMGRNDVGIWYAGVMLDDLKPEQVERFRGSTVSGHWVNGELRAIVAVNAPGYLDAHTTDADGIVAREFTQEQRERMADDGEALPDGSFPIANRTDLHNAIQAVGRASDRNRAQAHIIKRAGELGLESELPDWMTSPSARADLERETTMPPIETPEQTANATVVEAAEDVVFVDDSETNPVESYYDESTEYEATQALITQLLLGGSGD